MSFFTLVLNITLCFQQLYIQYLAPRKIYSFIHIQFMSLKRGVVTIEVCKHPRELLVDDEMLVIENNRYQQC
jgi:hypothetical protein